MSSDRDRRVRRAAFDFLEHAVREQGEVLSWSFLLKGFTFEGERVPLLSQQGIFKPAALKDAPLSIRTAAPVEGKESKYDDRVSESGLLVYRYRGIDARHPDNEGLRRAFRERIPLIHLLGIVPGRYLPSWPVLIESDDPKSLAFTVRFDEPSLASQVQEGISDPDSEIRRRYATVQAVKRMHQHTFRERVILAYRTECAVCHLKHAELLDAAHILPDGHPKGAPVVSNGLAMCKLHHAAFDSNLLGIRPDRVIEIRRRLLDEEDGPMLLHGLQGFHEKSIVVPHRAEWKPNREFLEERFEKFRHSA